MNLVSNSRFCLDLELEFELGVDNYEKLDYIIKHRKCRLTKKQILDRTKYQEGNIVLATNVPSSKSTGTSQELNMTVKGIYYVKSVLPSHLRLIGFLLEKRGISLVNMLKKSHWTISPNCNSNYNLYNFKRFIITCLGLTNF